MRRFPKFVVLIVLIVGKVSCKDSTGGVVKYQYPAKMYSHHRMKTNKRLHNFVNVTTIISPPEVRKRTLPEMRTETPPTWASSQGDWLPIPQKSSYPPPPTYHYVNPASGATYSHAYIDDQGQPETNALIEYHIPVENYYAAESPNFQYDVTPTLSSNLGPHYRRQFLTHPSGKVCDGKKNLVDDFGIVSLILSAFSTFVGFSLDLVLSFKANAVAIIAKIFSLIFTLPSSYISAINVANPFTYLFSNGLNILSIATTLFGTGAGVSVGNLSLGIDILFEILGIYGLFLSIFSTFPDLFDEVVEAAFVWGVGPEVKAFIEGYGCQNPYYEPTSII